MDFIHSKQANSLNTAQKTVTIKAEGPDYKSDTVPIDQNKTPTKTHRKSKLETQQTKVHQKAYRAKHKSLPSASEFKRRNHSKQIKQIHKERIQQKIPAYKAKHYPTPSQRLLSYRK